MFDGIVAISGKAGSGKSTAAYLLRNRLNALAEPETGGLHPWGVVAFADELKRIVSTACGFPITFAYAETTKAMAAPVHRLTLIEQRDLPIAIEDGQLAIINARIAEASRDFPTIRQMLQLTGELFRQVVDEDYWIRALEHHVLNGNLRHVIIEDLRYKNELRWAKKHNGILVRIARWTPVMHHVSETELDDCRDWDFSVYNNGDDESVLHGQLCDALDVTLMYSKKLSQKS